MRAVNMAIIALLTRIAIVVIVLQALMLPSMARRVRLATTLTQVLPRIITQVHKEEEETNNNHSHSHNHSIINLNQW